MDRRPQYRREAKPFHKDQFTLQTVELLLRAPDSSILRLTSTIIIPWSMKATMCGLVASGSRAAANIRAIA
jgi:hypothetical protein